MILDGELSCVFVDESVILTISSEESVCVIITFGGRAGLCRHDPPPDPE